MDKLLGLLRATPILASIIEGTLGVKADFTPESLQNIEKAINRVYPVDHEPMFSTIVSYGIYLGEVLFEITRCRSGAHTMMIKWNLR
ncbi:MAG: hypothetical protein ACE3L7_05135 [Candidatus Pristimantibacillus sp.]